jgi:uncharacterized LabA/DUF88 family protein
MSDTAAFICDSEYVDAMFQRVAGRSRRCDPVKLCHYLENNIVAGRTLLWTRWYVPEMTGLAAEARQKRQRYFDWLRRSGIRVIQCSRKPICEKNGTRDENCCDFLVADGIYLACEVATTVIVATGDGHLRTAIDSAHRRHGRRVEVFCEQDSVSSQIEADRFIYLEDIISTADLTREGNHGNGGGRKAA